MGLIRGIARTAVVAGTATAVSGRVQHRQQQRWAAQEEQQYAARQYEMQQMAATPPPPAASPVQQPADDTTEQLTQLARLRDQGVLTDEEFAAAKRRLLGI